MKIYKLRHIPTGLFSKKGSHQLVPYSGEQDGWDEEGYSWARKNLVLNHLRMLMPYNIEEYYKPKNEYMVAREKLLKDFEVVEWDVNVKLANRIPAHKALPQSEHHYNWLPYESWEI